MTITIKRLESWPRAVTRIRGIKRGNADYAKTRARLIEHLRELGATDVALAVAMNAVSQAEWPHAGTHPAFPGVCLVVASRYGQLIFCCDKFSVWTHNLRAIVDTMESAHKIVGLGTVQPHQLYATFQEPEVEQWVKSGALTGNMGQLHIPSAKVNSNPKRPTPKASAPPNYNARSGAPSGAARPTPPPPPPPRTPPRKPSAPPLKETFDTRAQAADWLAAQTGTPTAHILGAEAVFLSAYRKAARLLHPDVGGDPIQFRRLQHAKAAIERGAIWTKTA